MKILNVVGARPQFVKAATVERVAQSISNLQSIIVHTGQHYDHNMSQIFFDELQIPYPKYNLEVGSKSHGAQTGEMLRKIEDVIIKEKPDWVLVYGDTNSTIAASLAASKLHIKVAHVEAGLRSYNRKMPEEINRISTDRISDLLFVPTMNAFNILKKEGLGEKAIFSGDVMYDSVEFYKNIISDRKLKIDKVPKKYFLATIHRPQNTDNPERLRAISDAFAELNYPVILPLHPRTRNLMDKDLFQKNVELIEPVGYLDILNLVQHSEKVLTDSGGLQKEAFFMQKQCVTLRDETEWIETLEDNWNTLTGADKDLIIKLANSEEKLPQQKNHFGDGNAAEIIIKNILKETD